MRTFEHQVYDTNGATPKQNAINHLNARNEVQNDLAKKGGAATTVPQFRSSGPEVSPQNSNSNIVKVANVQARSDRISEAQANTGKPINGGKKKSKKRKKKKNKKSRKY